MSATYRAAALMLTSLVWLPGCDSSNAPQSWQEYALGGAYSAALSDDARLAIVGSFNHGGSLWEVNAQARLFDWNHVTPGYSIISAAGFSPNADYAVTATQQDLVLWDVTSGQARAYWSAPAEIMQLDLSPDGNFALLGLADHTAVLFDVKRGGVQRSLRHDARVRSVDLSNDGRYAVTGSDAYNTHFWDIQQGTQLQSISLGNVVDTVALSPDAQRAFSSGSLDKAIIWNTQTGEILHTLSDINSLKQQRISYLSARFSNDGEQLLTGTASGLVQLWNVASGEVLNSWRVHKRDPYGPVHAGVYAVAFGADGDYYALGSNGILNQLR
ncbi:WD40 repeat domain-containing protein [Pontibacter sp. JAM-7]|uniref:WD40 repeat domain-containing protein n=1 Tax=Pontibacter sp. JAM-7 TaxID=3366581 RepID=UPI003AF86A2F